MSVLHRVDDPFGMSSSRYFDLAELLYSYQGAVRTRLLAEQQTRSAPQPVARQSSAQPVVEDMSLMAAISNQPGFPGIEYVGG